MKQIKLQLTGGNNKGTRKKADFYSTPADVTKALLNFLRIYCPKLPEKMKVWECACGSGDMAEVISSYGHTVFATDIRKNTGYGNGGVNFLTHWPARSFDAIITNPPFRFSELFIRKAVLQAPAVAFLLKSQYWHAGCREPLFRQFRPAFVLPVTWRVNFDPNRGSCPTMEVLWTVWIRGIKKTCYVPLTRPEK